MATRGRRPTGEATTSAERKAQFDARMRNADGLIDGAPRRTPCVLYLSDPARNVLRKNRLARRVSRSGPQLDAELVEELLLNYEGQRSAGTAKKGALKMPTALAALQAPVLAEFERLNNLLRRTASELARSRERLDQLEQAAAQPPKDPLTDQTFWERIEDALVERHRKHSWLWAPQMAQRLRSILRSPVLEAEAMYELSREFEARICDLCDQMDYVMLQSAKSTQS